MLGQREISKIIYSLKREWGVSIQVCRSLIDERDILTGKIYSECETFTIRRAINLPYEVSRETLSNFSLIASRKSNDFGGFYDESVTVLIIDAQDLPKSFIFKNTDYLMIESKKHEIVNYTKAGNGRAYVLNIKTIEAP